MISSTKPYSFDLVYKMCDWIIGSSGLGVFIFLAMFQVPPLRPATGPACRQRGIVWRSLRLCSLDVMFVNVIFFQLEAEQRRHGVNVHAGRVFEQLLHDAAHLELEGSDRDAHRTGAVAFAAAGAASGEVHRVDELEEHLLRGAVFLREPMRFAAVRHAVVAAHAHGAGVAAGIAADAKRTCLDPNHKKLM